MIDLLLRTAIALVRAWTRVYTWQMPADEREARRSEIESDLWELQHDADTRAGTGAALHICARLFLGVPDDVLWRVEHVTDARDLLVRRTMALTVVAAFVTTALWILPACISRDARSARTRIVDCADELPEARTTPEFRMRVIGCAGAFFKPTRVVGHR